MSEKKVKKREGKAININEDIHKMLKIQSTLTDKKMIELVETAILNSMPDEILAIFNMTKDIDIEVDKNIKIEKNKNEDNINEDNNIKEKTDDEIDDEIDDETSCYM
ncbi:MAG: hypothetical protein ACRCXT_04715 [Paraclostridium sp.]